MRGTVKHFDDDKGYGFIGREDGGKDVFVHHSAVLMEGRRTLHVGDEVEFNIEDSDRGPRATAVQLVGIA